MAYILIDRGNFYHNLNQLALKAGSKDRLAVVLKDNAYGHGLRLMGELSRDYGIREAVVVTNDEADQISDLFDHILVLGDSPRPSSRCSYAVSEIGLLRWIEPGVLIELKVDTGMHRNGIEPERLEEALEIIRKRKLRLFGVITHYRSADELTSEYFWQKKRFDEVKKRVIDAGFSETRFHSHNSAALLRCRNFDEDIARVGIAIYGYNTLPKGFEGVELKPVLSLWARRASTRRLQEGARIGYGGEFTADREMPVSTYDLGYGDGWPRGRASEPYRTAEGKAILGRVSMDFISVEGEADRICVMEDARRAARHFGTICYEMTTALMPTIPRRVVD
ncbi:alanine racemase [Nitratifractor salsuginis]|uniref:Alanine racemase n=1 Tax=Nitratifractor salsuginis (strain DSM 16511 / JCM 12458 / E9I37-1) TaxID=749222 RepID=E6WZ35_NITSE|nr:alanine racemase [Nitratifractor salsuginis]ADV45485.1 alanine racemase [Nitratifractor salsuginis DSM 16511]